MFKELKEIDFSGGIRSELIQHNFEAVDDMIARERLAIGGHGIASGLQFVINDFNLTIKEGFLIDLDGKEVYIPETQFKIPHPRLKEVREEVHVVEHNGVISLPAIPYSPTRKHVATTEEMNNGITITSFTNALQKYACRTIQDNKISVDASLANESVKVSYSYTNPRIDTVFINEDHEIEILEGTSSTSPSVIIPERYTYLLGFVEVDPYYLQDDKKIAKLKIKKDLKSLRNIFTDSDNNLWICGIPFDDLQIIHMEEPKDPHENQLWFDTVALKLKVWKVIDGIGQWVNVNDTSVVPVLESKIWVPDEAYLDTRPGNALNPEDLQTFIFHNTEDLNMRFIPKKNELSVYLDQGVLHSDQYYEITLADAKEDEALKLKLINEYGYTQENIDDCNEVYENIGIGFKLSMPLTKPCFIEARVTHRVNENPLRVRFQRTANFTFKKHLLISDTEKTFQTDRPYRFGENQLQVFLNGAKLVNDLDYREIPKQAKQGYVPTIGELCSSFELLVSLGASNKLEYLINETLYSYDHLDQLISENVTVEIDEVKEVSNEAMEEARTAKQAVANLQSDHGAAIEKLEEQNQEHDLFIKSSDKISEEMLDETLSKRIPKGTFNKKVTKQGQNIELFDIGLNDFILAVNLTTNQILVRKDREEDEGDYIISQDSSGRTYMVFNEVFRVSDGTPIYLTGMRF